MKGDWFCLRSLNCSVTPVFTSLQLLILSLYGAKCIVSNVAEGRKKIIGSGASSSSASSFSLSCIYLVSRSGHFKLLCCFKLLNTSMRWKWNLLSQLHCAAFLTTSQAEKGSSSCMWPLNYTTFKPRRLSQHFLLSFILARFPRCSTKAMSLCVQSAGGIRKRNTKRCSVNKVQGCK